MTGKTENRAIANVPPQPAEAAETAKTGETAGMAAAANITDSYKTDKPCVTDEFSADGGGNDLLCLPG